MIKEKNIAVCLILSIITCGIYSIYWFICLSDDVNSLSKEEGTTGGVALLLNIITCGIYGLYWCYKQGEKLDTIKTSRGIPSSNSGVLYLILSLVGLGIITYMLMQNEINKLI